MEEHYKTLIMDVVQRVRTRHPLKGTRAANNLRLAEEEPWNKG